MNPFKPSNEISVYLKNGLWIALDNRTMEVVNLGYSRKTSSVAVLQSAKVKFPGLTVELI